VFVPAPFRGSDLAVLDRLLTRDPFVTLVTSDADGAPFASHVPVLWQRESDAVELRGHVARANPQWQHDGPALVIVHGPHAHISPSWYADTDSADRVPTWNYAVAHLHGTPQWLHEDADLADIVTDLSERFERAVGSRWRFDPQRSGHRTQLRGIVGFRLPIARIDLKLKLNQNHPTANVLGVVQGLRAQGRTDTEELAAWMMEAANSQRSP